MRKGRKCVPLLRVFMTTPIAMNTARNPNQMIGKTHLYQNVAFDEIRRIGAYSAAVRPAPPWPKRRSM
jgi:hypothetical protein